ncbi:pyridine nucleotide-disulfide oxidoreductase [Mesobaculum littorinae]|uniref:Pyridine nucleotide-disulfide oxidoreductase n=1 Tax=Mesobaculum littorinae TaxID=2486419 RepID=A0A438AJL7_9RHOB|nr:FAD-dependent oxidoreductase [Mesobaculum littorinae]RVV98868.1 pyridine nucleotide-disulfide oxidoreductase [Mesobaculum littorinae]
MAWGPPPARVVIVGAGQGGFQAAASLRQEKFEGEILLIGAEEGLPYQRPPLSKAYLKSGDAEALNLRPAAFFEKNDVTLRPGTRVTSIDRDAQRVQAGGSEIPYDHLILATGTSNLRPTIEGLDRALDLRTLVDAQRLRVAMEDAERCAVIGGGFIGLEFAAVARGLGRRVIVAEASDRLMARVVSPEMSARFADKHCEIGTELALGRTVTSVSSGGIAFDDGTEMPADLVLLAAGVRPNDDLAREAGLACDNGIVVDATLLTADPAISALGDCAAFPDPRTGRMVRLESVQAATDHARAVARRLVHGTEDPYAAVPWFWSDQADWKLQITGFGRPQDDSVRTENGAILRFDGEVLSAVETVNDAKTHMKSRRLMAAALTDPGAGLVRDRLASVGYDLLAL